jgi:hypothetical protein
VAVEKWLDLVLAVEWCVQNASKFLQVTSHDLEGEHGPDQLVV